MGLGAWAGFVAKTPIGNLNHALELLGGTIHDDEVHNIHTLEGGVVRHVHKWEHEAIHKWHQIK